MKRVRTRGTERKSQTTSMEIKAMKESNDGESKVGESQSNVTEKTH
ncbi:putative ATP binding protein [Corchorus olitorius]|uniref:ATP binding protein n=1 Tax=Corchorus olitorius TaxID=93759 RepID=A0A1R3G8A2_9ROSI|nr:putative ATP binding protein [Corchorus olitorius]